MKNLSLSRNFEEYKQEIELSCLQNRGVEIELYSIIACVIRESYQGNKISVRDVSRRRSSSSYTFVNNYKSDSGFPDFVVLERKLESNVNVLGCIEAKMPSVNLNLEDEQIQEHIRCFKKVIYTNGIRWIYSENNQEKFDISLGKITNIETLEIKWEQEKLWNDLIKEIDSIKWNSNL